jgi:hypothetical protein
LSINIIRRMTHEAIGIGDLLSGSGLEEHGIRGQRKGSMSTRFLSRPGYLSGSRENGSCRDEEEEE